jgi:hypothetical protein
VLCLLSCALLVCVCVCAVLCLFKNAFGFLATGMWELPQISSDCKCMAGPGFIAAAASALRKLGRKYSRTRSRASSQQITSDPNVQATSSKRCGPASIHTRVFAIKSFLHCACLPRGSPVEPSSDAALLRPAVNSPRATANFGAKKCQHRIESAIGEPLCGTSLSIKDLYATPGIQKLLSEPHLKDSTSRATFQSVSIVSAAC